MKLQVHAEKLICDTCEIEMNSNVFVSFILLT